MIPKTIENVIYKGAYSGGRKSTKSLKVIGVDTEAYTTGKCFMIATSLGDVFKPSEYPKCFFSRKYQNCNLVAYNLKYDQGAFIQHLPRTKLNHLRELDICTYKGFIYKVIVNKALSIRKGSHICHMFDMLGFYKHSLPKGMSAKLDNVANYYLNASKDKIDRIDFTPQYVRYHWDEIARYCIKDAELVQRLGELIIAKFEEFDVYPKKLYSTAYISYRYFVTHCKYPIVKRYWDNDRDVLKMAMLSFQGGKFEVTKKYYGDLWEYDIISAYPAQIENLADITQARIEYSKVYRKSAYYGFVDCTINIGFDFYSPSVVNRNGVCMYPIGKFRRVITKTEYEYLTVNGINIKIHNAIWLYIDRKVYPFREEIRKLVAHKQALKKNGKPLDIHTIKIFLNSLYGKFVQLVDQKICWKASACWNPIYGSIITSNVRCIISEMQQTYPSIIAVHTDSIISTKPLEFPESGKLGDMVLECSGKGAVLGSGIYQVGGKTAIRGYHLKIPLLKLLDNKVKKLEIAVRKCLTWREVVFHKWELDLINRFIDDTKHITPNFDKKRLWVKDYEYLSDIFKRCCYSTPHICNNYWHKF